MFIHGMEKEQKWRPEFRNSLHILLFRPSSQGKKVQKVKICP
ncbi:hypothetical protein DB29_00581 [Shouchella clausii]|nr:hypothetical protein DB29_00581 [Shouchella clausii]